MQRNSDRDWQKLGEIDAYFGVFTSDDYKSENVNAQELETFFASGQAFVDRIFTNVYEYFSSDFKPKRGLDFGCGTARLTIPLARYCDSIIGVDIAQGMLEKARIHAQEAGVDNVSFVLSDDVLSAIKEPVDFILSYIVLQHIPTKRGEKIFEHLVSKLAPDGVACVHLPFLRDTGRLRRLIYRLRVNIPPLHYLLNLRSGRPLKYPLLQYNAYDINRLFQILQQQDCDQVHVQLESRTDVSGIYRSAYLYFRRNAKR